MHSRDILKQKNVGTWWGAFRNLGSYVSFYMFIFNTFLTLINTYILGRFTQSDLPAPIWVIILVAVVPFVGLLVAAMVFEHKYTLPSYMTYWNQQWWKHGNKLPGEIIAIREQLDRLEKALGEIRK